MSGPVALDLTVIFAAILVLVSLANRIGVAYPIVLVLGGMLLGYVPGIPPLAMPPDVVLTVFLPPLLYWESVSAPTSELFSGSGVWWMFQLAIGLVIVTTLAVAGVAHALIPGMAWGTALVLGAIVSSTDEVAFGPIIERVRIPRHVIATIEGESLLNDATSLVLYGIAVAAVASGTFSLAQGAVSLVVSVVGAIAIGIVAAGLAVLAWRWTRDDMLQLVVSIMAPYVAYLPALHFGVSGVLAVVTAGLLVSHFTPRVLLPRARDRAAGFWSSIVFVLNAFIFVLVGMQFRTITAGLAHYSAWQLALSATAVCLTVIVVRLLWVFGQGLIPATNEPEHESGEADWSHVFVLAWSGMRGGISLAAALAIPIEAASKPFPQRDLIIFLTFCVLLATLVGQGGTLPWLLRRLNVQDDGTDAREERIALATTAKAALKRLDALAKTDGVSPWVHEVLKRRFNRRWAEYQDQDADEQDGMEAAARDSAELRRLERELIDAQRKTLIGLRDGGKVDNTVMRRIQRLLDLQVEEMDLLEQTGRTEVDVEG